MKHATIICPYCGYELTDDDMYESDHDLYALARNEDDVNEPCPSCKEVFEVSGSYLPRYETSKLDEEEE